MERNSYFMVEGVAGEGGDREILFLLCSVWIPSLKKGPPTSGGSSPLVNPETPSRTQLPESCFPNLLYTSPSNQVDNQEKETLK